MDGSKRNHHDRATHFGASRFSTSRKPPENAGMNPGVAPPKVFFLGSLTPCLIPCRSLERTSPHVSTRGGASPKPRAHSRIGSLRPRAFSSAAARLEGCTRGWLLADRPGPKDLEKEGRPGGLVGRNGRKNSCGVLFGVLFGALW